MHSSRRHGAHVRRRTHGPGRLRLHRVGRRYTGTRLLRRVVSRSSVLTHRLVDEVVDGALELSAHLLEDFP